jgi:ElaB/YqjD/DUF883 family membrane-anchored ribosome-binding protein
MSIAVKDTATTETVKRDLSALQQGVKDLQNTAITKANAQLQERPIQALLLAFGVGFLASRFMRHDSAPAK